MLSLTFATADAPLSPVSRPFGLYPVEIQDEFSIGKLYGVEPQLLRAMAIVESNSDHTAVNPATLDFGILQINYKTAEAYDIDIHRLTHDRAYSIEQGAFILSTFQKQFASKEPETWVCRYNVGWGELTGKRLWQCNEYIRKVKIAYGPKEDW